MKQTTENISYAAQKKVLKRNKVKVIKIQTDYFIKNPHLAELFGVKLPKVPKL